MISPKSLAQLGAENGVLVVAVENGRGFPSSRQLGHLLAGPLRPAAARHYSKEVEEQVILLSAAQQFGADGPTREPVLNVLLGMTNLL